MMKGLQIDIKKDGTISIEALGYEGNGCEQISAAFEEALGTVTDKEYKPEYFTQAQNTEQDHIKRR